MTDYALIENNAVADTRPWAVPPEGGDWRPIVVDDPTFDPVTQRRLLVPEMVIEADQVVRRFTIEDKSTEEVAAEASTALAQAKATKAHAARSLFNAKVIEGYPYEGLHVEINDGSRANLTGLALTATLVLLGVPGAVWPEDYGRGWVSIEGERIPLTAQTAIPFASAAGTYYSALVQYEQDLEDDISAAADHAALEGIDITAGWPT